MIIGNTHDETRILIGGSHPEAFTLSWEELAQQLAAQMRADIAPETRRCRVSPAVSAALAERCVLRGDDRRVARGAPAIVEAELRAAQGSPAFVYQLDWKSPRDGGKWGAPHTLDIPLVFDNLDKRGLHHRHGPRARTAWRTR